MVLRCRVRWLLCLVMLLLMAAASCARGDAPLRIRLSDLEVETPQPSTNDPDSQVLRIAVAAVISPRETFDTYRDLLNYLGRKLDRPVELVQGKTYAEINDLVRSRDLTAALVCTNPYLEGQEAFGMEALAIPVIRGKPVYYSYLIVRQDGDIQSLAEVRGKTFAFTDPLSNSGRLAPLYQLALLGERPETFFRRYIFTYSHDNSIEAVAEGVVDGAAVDSLIYDYLQTTNPALVARTRIIHRSPLMGAQPVGVPKNLDPETKQALRELFLGLDLDPTGRGILKKLGVDRFIPGDDSLYDSIRKMLQVVEGAKIR